MKERPILFSTEMVQAILQGRKTQTRRVVKPLLQADAHSPWIREDNYRLWQWCVGKANVCYSANERLNPFGIPGDLLWVREKHAVVDGVTVFCSYDDYFSPVVERWKPSIHMPKAAARIWLQVTDVRVERLHDISDDEAIAEGIYRYPSPVHVGETEYKDYWEKDWDKSWIGFLKPRVSFMSLWESIHGNKSWKANPWVWVVEFEVISRNGKP